MYCQLNVKLKFSTKQTFFCRTTLKQKLYIFSLASGSIITLYEELSRSTLRGTFVHVFVTSRIRAIERWYDSIVFQEKSDGICNWLRVKQIF